MNGKDKALIEANNELYRAFCLCSNVEEVDTLVSFFTDQLKAFSNKTKNTLKIKEK